jgi:serine/threonine protein kinase
MRGAEIDPLIGTTVGGRFVITRLVGEGWSSRVYVGEMRMGARSREIAIKVLCGARSADERVVARFRREVATLCALSHPATVEVYDFGTTDSGEHPAAAETVVSRCIQ